MSSIRSYGRRVGSLFAVAALTLATITPGLIPSFASAAQLTERSIALSNSSKAATGVEYTITFTPALSADALIIDFCSDSPLLNVSCAAPGGFTAASATSSDATVNTSIRANTLSLTTALTADTEKEITIAGITNPTASGPLYARITTYTSGNLAGYSSATSLGTYRDSGSAAVSITDTIGVSGAVLETMTFCVSGPDNDGDPVTIGDSCTGTLYAPTLKLGEKTGDVIALSPTVVSTGSLYTQLSTNASSGAIVSLKSSAAGCGGLMRAGDDEACDIAPAQATGISAGQAKFGVRTTAASGGVGALLPVTGSNYNTTTYALNYNSTDESTGVTSTYGDKFIDTAGAPASNKNMEIVFGASVAPNTPAGNYSASLSLIATGKF